VDIGKIAEFAEKYARDYVLTVLSIVTNPRAVPEDGSAEQALTLSSGRIWLFAATSILLGTIAYTAGVNSNFSPTDPTLIGLILTLWLWILAGVVAHGVA
jgi:hypothetical protein